MAEATVSSKNQIVIPKEAREALKTKPGDKLLVTVMGDGVFLYPKPKNYLKAIKSLIGADYYGPDYIKKLRSGSE